MKTINYRTIELYAQKIEKENLNNGKRTLCWVSMLNDVPVRCVHHGTNKVDVDDDWKSHLNKHIL